MNCCTMKDVITSTKQASAAPEGGRAGILASSGRQDAVALAESYYLAAGRTRADMEQDCALMDVCIRTPLLVLMARLVESAAPAPLVVNINHRFSKERCDAWHLHFVAGQAPRLLDYERLILMQPWILTQHGKRGDGRLVKLSSARFCRLLKAQN